MKPTQRYQEDKAGLLRLCFVLFCFLVLGCRSAPVTVVSPEHYVQWETLAALHPLWKSPVSSSLERQADVLPLQDPVALAALPSDVAIPDTQAEERQQNIVVQTDNLRKQYALSLERADAQRIEREVGLRRKELTTTYRREIQELARKLSDEEDGNRRYIVVQLQNLGYYEVIYKTGVEQSGGTVRDLHYAKLERVRKQLRSLQLLLDRPKPDMIAVAEARLKSRQVELERQVGAFRAEITQKAQENFIRALTQAGASLKAELQAISPLKMAVAKQEYMPVVLELPAIEQQATYQKGQENRVLAVSLARQTEEKSRIVREALVRTDVFNAVKVLFAKRGWKRVERGVKGATDVTEEVARSLREQWSLPTY